MHKIQFNKLSTIRGIKNEDSFQKFSVSRFKVNQGLKWYKQRGLRFLFNLSSIHFTSFHFQPNFTSFSPTSHLPDSEVRILQ